MSDDVVIPMMKRLIFLLCLTTGGIAAAQAPALPNRPIPRAEVIGIVRQQFAAMDANHDGAVTRAEADAYRAKQRDGGDPFRHIGGHWFDRADTNGDGRVTLAEAQARPLSLFDMADVDRDGVVSVQEGRMAMMLMSFGK